MAELKPTLNSKRETYREIIKRYSGPVKGDWWGFRPRNISEAIANGYLFLFFLFLIAWIARAIYQLITPIISGGNLH